MAPVALETRKQELQQTVAQLEAQAAAVRSGRRNSSAFQGGGKELAGGAFSKLLGDLTQVEKAAPSRRSPHSMFAGLQDSHLAAYLPAKASSNMFTRPRLEVKQWLLGLAPHLASRVALRLEQRPGAALEPHDGHDKMERCVLIALFFSCAAPFSFTMGHPFFF